MGGLEITSIHEMGFMLKDKCGFLFDLLSPGGAAVQSKRQGDRGGDQQQMRGGLGEAGAGRVHSDRGQWICALTNNHLDTVKHHWELEIQLPSTPGQMVLSEEIRN